MNKHSRQELKSAWNDPVKATLIQRNILDEKFLLRQWYEGIYCFITRNLKEGPVNIELGSGNSYLYKHINGLIRTNIISIPDNEITFDAYAMPFKDDSVDNLILISVFHHLGDPERFLREAMRVLKIKGRVLISDPYISMYSYVLWRFLHPEGCDLYRVGFDKSIHNNPLLDANSANATLIFTRKSFKWRPKFPRFRILNIRYHTIFHYWLAGGYNLPPFVPGYFLGGINFAEKLLTPIGNLLASFMYVILEKDE